MNLHYLGSLAAITFALASNDARVYPCWDSTRVFEDPGGLFPHRARVRLPMNRRFLRTNNLMTSDQSSPDIDKSTPDVPPAYVPPRPPPQKKLPLLKMAIRVAIGLGIAAALYFFTGNRSLSKAGPKYTSDNITWQSVDPTWSTMWGEHALDMTVNPSRIRGSTDGTFKVTGAILRSLCGSVLTKLPDPPDGVTRKDIYRLGFRFYDARDQSQTEVFPIPVQDGACVAYDDQVIFDWSYPGPLTGWSPVRYEGSSKEHLTVFYGRRGDVKVPYDQVDLKLACEALFLESTDRMREVLAEAKELEIRAVKGVVSPVFWAGAYQSQTFQIVNGTCLVPGEIIDG